MTDTVLSETVDRALGIGTRADRAGAIPGQLLGHFLVKGLPLSPLALLALLSLFPRAGRERHASLVLPCAAFAVGLALLSLSRGQRQDYVLIFLPVAAVAAGAVLDEASRGARQIWRLVLLASGGAALAACVLVVAGPPWTPQALASLDLRWTALLGLAGGVLWTAAWLDRVAASAGPRIAHVATGIASLVALQLVYNDAL